MHPHCRASPVQPAFSIPPRTIEKTPKTAPRDLHGKPLLESATPACFVHGIPCRTGSLWRSLEAVVRVLAIIPNE